MHSTRRRDPVSLGHTKDIFTDTPNSVATARWCVESARPFTIVKDRCYKWLQREGNPNRFIPTREQVLPDVKKLYQKSKKQLASELQEFDGELSVALDCWTSPNHRPWMSITISRLRKTEDGAEEPVTHILDFVELPCSHTSRNMAECVIIKEYSIENKVSVTYRNNDLTNVPASSDGFRSGSG